MNYWNVLYSHESVTGVFITFICFFPTLCPHAAPQSIYEREGEKQEDDIQRIVTLDSFRV